MACSYLGPLAASNPSLLKPLKETLLALLRPNEDAQVKGIPVSVLATSLQVLSYSVVVIVCCMHSIISFSIYIFTSSNYFNQLMFLS